MKYVAILIILMATSIIQWHGMMFWTEHAGASGWGWSIVLEAAALWLWWQPKWHIRALGLIGTIIVLCGPMYQISAPAISALKNGQANKVEIAALQQNLTLQKNQLTKFLENSTKRTGWLPSIQSTQTAIQTTQDKINTLTRSKDGKPFWEVMALVAIEMMALIVITFAQITSVKWLSEKQHAAHAKREGSEPDVLTVNDEMKQSEPEQTEVETENETPALPRVQKAQKTFLKLVGSSGAPSAGEEARIREYIKVEASKYKTKKEAAEAIGIDRRELGCILSSSGRKPKQDTWVFLAASIARLEMDMGEENCA